MAFKKLWLYPIFLSLLCAGSGCTSPTASSSTMTSSFSSRTEEIVIEDDLNQRVSFAYPKRVAVLIGSFTDSFLDVGGKEQLVAAAHDSWTSFDLDLQDVVDLGDVKSISTETLLATKPDLVIASAKNDSQKKLKETLDSLNIPIVYFDVSSFEEYLHTLKRLSQITQNAQGYEIYGTNQQERIQAIQKKERSTSLKVLALRETGKGISALKQDSVIGEMLEDLKAENIAKDGNLSSLSMEVIQVENPDVILYVAQGKDLEVANEMAQKLFEDPAWKSLKAVQEGRVYVLDQRLYNLKPNKNWASALEDLEALIYEE